MVTYESWSRQDHLRKIFPPGGGGGVTKDPFIFNRPLLIFPRLKSATFLIECGRKKTEKGGDFFGRENVAANLNRGQNGDDGDEGVLYKP